MFSFCRIMRLPLHDDAFRSENGKKLIYQLSLVFGTVLKDLSVENTKTSTVKKTNQIRMVYKCPGNKTSIFDIYIEIKIKNDTEKNSMPCLKPGSR